MADEQNSERQPLLTDEHEYSPPPPYTAEADAPDGSQQPVGASAPNQQDVMGVPPMYPDEAPPPYTPSAPGRAPMVNCRVCQAMINLEGKEHQNVVKCGVCNEATPIRGAPPNKKYVRCPCNCLLICRATAQKIACPRANCKRIINLGTAPGTFPTVTVRSPDTCRIQCHYCNQTFLFSVLATTLVRCPHCRRVSTTNPAYIRTRMMLYIIVGMVFLGGGIGVTVGTYEMAENSGGIYTVWIGAFVIGLIFIVRGAYLSSIKTSHVINSAA